MIILHQAFCDHCSTIKGESELSRYKHRNIPTNNPVPSQHTYAVVTRDFLWNCQLDLEHASVLHQLSTCTHRNKTKHLIMEFVVKITWYWALQKIVLGCAGYEKSCAIYSKWNKVQSMICFPSKFPYMVLFIPYMVFVDSILLFNQWKVNMLQSKGYIRAEISNLTTSYWSIIVLSCVCELWVQE